MATPLGLNLREKGKLERRQRIERAAREVFRERGFDAATTREIAARAGVGNATLFLYERDKTQLLAWVFRDELAAVNESALTPLTGDEPLVDRLERFFRPRYELWARDPRLSRAAVRAALMAHTERGEERDGDPIATLWPDRARLDGSGSVRRETAAGAPAEDGSKPASYGQPPVK